MATNKIATTEFATTKLFSLLDKELKEEENLTIEYVKKEDCCNNKKIIIDYEENIEICENCGKFNKYEHDDVSINNILNEKFKLSTKISSFGNFNKIRRLQLWGTYNHKEVKANISYKEIYDICERYRIPLVMVDRAKFIYKKIYIIEKNSPRDKIKNSIFIICILVALIEFNEGKKYTEIYKEYEIDMINILLENKLSLSNYNNAMKIYFTKTNEYKLSININTIKMKEEINRIFGILLDNNEMIYLYNEILEIIKKNNKKRLNKNTILYTTGYILLNNLNSVKTCDYVKYFKITEKKLNEIIRRRHTYENSIK
jgi:hypothetical protein